MSEKDKLREEVDAFLREFGMLPTIFSREATGDPAFVTRLRRVRKTVTIETAAKVRAYMSERREAAKKRSSPRPTSGAVRASKRKAA